MKIKVVLVIFGLLVFVFCTGSASHAAMSPKYHIRPPVYEHPWQHDGSPDPGDSSEPNFSPVMIWPISASMNSVLLIRLPERGTGLKQVEKDATICQEDKHRFQGR